MRFLEVLRPLGLLILRLSLGLIFLYHGWPKLFSDPGHYAQMFAKLGFAGPTSYAIGALELFGGGLLIVGFFTRPISLLLSAEMATAIWKVHLAKGYLAVNEYQFPLIVGAACFALATCGAGGLSLDELLLPSKAPRAGGAKPKPPK
ncbi:MAG TPA: DoxX family protein [Patescibacteria group bacterium]|nr:DoxX family protein [Patescibacteria group bacterium]